MDADARQYSIDEGRELVWTTRHVIETLTTSPIFDRKIAEERLNGFDRKHGVFVTLEHYPTKALRGSVGFPEPVGPVRSLLVDAAVAAVNSDPRFVPVSHRELDHVTVEVSLLSVPSKVEAKRPDQLPKKIEVGRDGLIVKYGYHSGLLLPIIAMEEGWDSKEFLDNACVKAGLPPHAWKTQKVSLFTFSTQVFREVMPRGQVEEVNLG